MDYEGTGSIPLRFSRTYNSKAPAGKRWRSNFDRNLDYVTSGATALRVANRADGSYAFMGTTSGSGWTSDTDVKYRLVGTAGSLSLVTPERSEIEIYGAQNLITRVQAASGGDVKYSFTYSTTSTPYSIAPAPNLLLRVADAFGHALTLTYNASSRIATMTDPAGGVYSYSYDGAGNLVSVTYPDMRVRQYVYGESALTDGVSQPGALTGIVDEDNSRYASFGYNSAGLAVLTEHAGGVQRYETSYSSIPNIQESLLLVGGRRYGVRSYIAPTGVTVTDPLGTVRTYGFSSVQGTVKATGASSLCTGVCSRVPFSQTLDANGNATLKTDFKGNQTAYVFDLARNLETSRTEAYGSPRARTISTSWHSTFRFPTLITEPNRKTAFTYNSRGDLLTRTVTDTSVSPNVSRKWTYTYDIYSRVLTEDGPRTDVSDVTTYTYYTCTTGYQCGHVSTIANALGHVTTYNNYNAHGQPIQITDPNGVVTTLDYDSRQRLTARCVNGTLPACVGGELTSIEYWPTGLLKKVTLPDGSFSSYGYDAAHRLIQVADSSGNHVDYTLDAMGNRTGEAVHDPGNTLRRTHTRVYNSLSQLYQDVNAASTGGATTSHAYDSNGNNTAINAPLSRFTNNVYDELNRLKQVTDPEFGDTYLAYDANDNLTSVTDPRGLVTSYTNNGFGDVKTTTSPDTGLTTNTYDTGGNLKTTTDARNAVATYNYDVLDRVTSVAYSKAGVTDQTIAYTYDAGANGKGQLTGASDADHSMSWVYDTSGRVTTKSITVGAVTLGVGYGYTNGRMSTLTLPSGNVVSYAYNSDGQVSGVQVGSTPLLSAATYEPFGPVSGWTWGNGVTHTRSYDEDGAIAAIGTSDTNGVNLGYTYDAGSRITSIFDAATNPNSWTFDYDLLDRLTVANGATQTQGWTYDANGNRLSETGTRARASTISATSNRLETLTGFLNRSYSYDAAGNATSYEDIILTYNNRGRLASNQKASYTRYYTYNALGQLAKATGGSGGTVHYAHDEAGHLLGEYDAAGGLIQETIWLVDTPVATIRPSGGGIEVFHVHADHLNTPVRVTQASDNALRWQWSRDPFGTMPANEDPSGLGQFVYNLRFPGQTFDGQVGLHQNHYRDYSPAIGRYIESDPIGLEAGINTYNYADGNPLVIVDPLGLDATAGQIAAAVIKGAVRGGARGGRVGPWGAAAGAAAGVAWAVYDVCKDNAEEKEKNCLELYKTIERSCKSIPDMRRRQKCYEAAKGTYEACMAE